MTYLLARMGRDFLYCLQLPHRRDVPWCRCPLPILDRTETEPPLEEQCRACRREMAWAQRRVTRDLRRGAA